MITREKVREAFRKGITADQIAMFLNKHAHEQMYIKKELEFEKDNPAGILVDSREQVAERTKKQNKDVMMNTKASVIPVNVVDQMKIWEEEMNSLEWEEGIMISDFENRDKYEHFKAFIKSLDIVPIAWNDKSMTIVVTLDKQKEVYEFINKH
jgi:transcription initiation factor TFIIH subunit 4